MASDLKAKTVSGMVWSAFDKFGVKLISFLSNIILARMLTPDDYGCIGMLMIFILISMTFVDGGFASALIQKKSPTKDDECTVFYWNLAVSLICYCALFFSAKSIANFYNIPKLEQVLKVQGIILFTNSLQIIQFNKLRRELRFKDLTKINITSAGLATVLAITAAFLGFGVWALVIQQLAQSVFNGIFAWLTCKWIPELRFSKESFKSLFGYGSFLLLSNLLNTFCDNLQGLLIGKRYSADDMGYYTQAKKLEDVPSIALSNMCNQVTFPVFSKIQDNKERLHSSVRQCLRMMNFINIPLMLFFIAAAAPIINVILSDKWAPSIPYFQILCIAGMIKCAISINYHAVLAVGKSKELFNWNIVKRSIGIVLILIGMKFGVIGILWGMVISFYITLLVNMLVAAPVTGYGVIAQLKDALPILLPAFIAAVLTNVVSVCISNDVWSLIASIFTFLVSFAILAWLFCRDIIKFYLDVIRTKVLKK